MGALDHIPETISVRLAAARRRGSSASTDLNGATTLAFLERPKLTPAAVAKTIGSPTDRMRSMSRGARSWWRFYIDVLFPDAYALQGIWNRALIDELEARSDALEEPATSTIS